MSSDAPSVTAFGAGLGISQSYATRLVRLAWLASDIVEAILDGRQPARLLDAGAEAYTELKNLCVWAKDNAGVGSLYATRQGELGRLLSEGRFVDLYVAVREAMRTSEPGLSLKNVERFHRPGRDGEVGNAGASIVAFERWLEAGDRSILDGIESYNRDDCTSTRGLRNWLVGLRPAGMPWPERPALDAEDEEEERKRAERDADEAKLRADLLGNTDGEEHDFRELVAHLMGFHWRERKPELWAKYHRQTLPVDDLIDDIECLGGLVAVGDPVQERRSLVQTYSIRRPDLTLRNAVLLMPCRVMACGGGGVGDRGGGGRDRL